MTTGAFTMLAESPLVRGMIAGGTEGGRLWLTTDDGGTWRRIDAGLPRHWTSRVTLSSHDAGTIYASFTAFREDDSRPYVFVSRDTGREWRASRYSRRRLSVLAKTRMGRQFERLHSRGRATLVILRSTSG